MRRWWMSRERVWLLDESRTGSGCWMSRERGLAVGRVENRVCCGCRAQGGSDSLYRTVHSRMSRLTCCLGLRLSGALFFFSCCVSVSSCEDRPFCTFCLQAHLSHASAFQVSVLIALAFRSRLQMSSKRSWLGSPCQPLPNCQFFMEKVLGDTAVLHAGDVAQPAIVWCSWR